MGNNGNCFRSPDHGRAGRADSAGILGVRVSVAMRLDVMLGSLLSMIVGVDVMSMGEMRVMRGRFMVSVGVMACGFAVVARGLLVVVRCLIVMMRCFV